MNDNDNAAAITPSAALTPVAAAIAAFEPDHAMLDLETLGKKPFCPILSIGACAFRMDGVMTDPDTFYLAVTLESCFAVGLRADASTIEWWMTDAHVSQEARDNAFAGAERVSLPAALDAFTDWLQSRPLQLWGNSARFDLGILEAAYQACGKEAPWDFRQERCYRTIKTLPGAADVPFTRIGTYHNALADAMSQAMHLREINRKLQLHL